MDVHLASKSIETNKDQLKYLGDLPAIYESDVTLEVLLKKKVFLIDVFHTFIQPVADLDDQMTYDRLGVTAFAKTRQLRNGFVEFLKYYSTINKKIGIHSDAFYKQEFKEMRQQWGIDKYVDKYFDRLYIKDFKTSKEWQKSTWGKNFGKMVKELESTRKDAIIITDGRNDIIAAKHSNIDILLIPDYNAEKDFDYKALLL